MIIWNCKIKKIKSAEKMISGVRLNYPSGRWAGGHSDALGSEIGTGKRLTIKITLVRYGKAEDKRRDDKNRQRSVLKAVGSLQPTPSCR